MALCLGFGAVWRGAAQPMAPGQFEELCTQVVRALKAGDRDGAERMAQSAFDLAQRFVAHDRRRVNIRLLRGEVARSGGKADLAEDWYRQAVSAAETSFGAESPEVIYPLEALANLYSLGGQRERALPVAARLLKIADAARPADPLEVARRCRNLAEAQIAAGHTADAEPYYRRAVQLAESFPAGLASDRAEYSRALAEYLWREHRVAEARPVAEWALTVAEKALGPDDLGLCVHLETLGDIRLAANDADAAVSHYERSLWIMERVAGSKSADLAVPLVRLATAERKRGHTKQAEALCDRATTLVTQGLGAEAPELAPVLEERAALLESSKQADAASTLRLQADKLRKRTNG